MWSLDSTHRSNGGQFPSRIAKKTPHDLPVPARAAPCACVMMNRSSRSNEEDYSNSFSRGTLRTVESHASGSRCCQHGAKARKTNHNASNLLSNSISSRTRFPLELDFLDGSYLHTEATASLCMRAFLQKPAWLQQRTPFLQGLAEILMMRMKASSGLCGQGCQMRRFSKGATADRG
jgi:hypothetical protein